MSRSKRGAPPFEFREFGRLTDGVVELRVEAKDPADPGKDLVPCYRFAVARAGSTAKIGEVRLRVGRVEATPSLLTSGQVGYEIDEAYRGHGYAARACALLRPVAVAHGFDALVITCDPANTPSRRTLERLGAELVGTFDVPVDHEMYRKGRRKVCRYVWRLGSDPRATVPRRPAPPRHLPSRREATPSPSNGLTRVR